MKLLASAFIGMVSFAGLALLATFPFFFRSPCDLTHENPRLAARHAAGTELASTASPQTSHDSDLEAEDAPRESAPAVAPTASKPGRLAGTYEYGFIRDDYGLELTERGEFFFHWFGCPSVGAGYADAGTVKLAGGYLVLTPSEARPGGAARWPTEFLPIRWGTRQYLVPKEGVLDFCNAINQGDEPRCQRHGSFFLRAGDWNQPAPGLPDLPTSWLEQVLAKPVQGELTAREGETHWRISLRANDGLRVGMRLTARGGPTGQWKDAFPGTPQRPGAWVGYLEVVAVHEDYSVVRPCMVGELRPGDQVTGRSSMDVSGGR